MFLSLGFIASRDRPIEAQIAAGRQWAGRRHIWQKPGFVIHLFT